MLNENQLKLLRHLARFNLLDYPSCLDMLNNDGGSDRTALSYAFRPLTKNRYVSKDKRGCVSILTKGRALFPELEPLLSAGGGEQTRQRIMEVSRMAALMERSGILVSAARQEWNVPYFIPSACWRKIAPGILSTTRFSGMLIAGKRRLAVYDIGDGAMEWQVRAEGSLFYTRYGSYETKATGMLLVCREGARVKAARNIIRQTMWNRRQLLREGCAERNRPVKWSRSPIKLKAQYGVNQVGGTGLGGAMDNGLNPTTTLGCGTWGGNSISENIYYHNLMNVSRISYRIKNKKQPTDEEIWAE